MSPNDVIEMPGQPGKWARRAIVEAWQTAGSPPVNSAGRLKAEQQRLYDGWRAGKPGFNPADNPANTSLPLAHVRFVALDIDPTPERVRRLTAAGLVRPYSYERWHWQLPGDVRRFPLVTSIPATAGGGDAAPISKEPTMRIAHNRNDTSANGAHFIWGDGMQPEVIGESTAAIYREAGVPQAEMERGRWLWLLEHERKRTVALEVWQGTKVARDGAQVPALQELADAKTAALKGAPSVAVDYDQLAAALVKAGGVDAAAVAVEIGKRLTNG